MRRLVLVLTAGAAGACGFATAQPATLDAEAPELWVEDEPVLDPRDLVDDSAWSGVWVEYFPGRTICQDRFVVQTEGRKLRVESIDCRTERPYSISEVVWDGQTLRFTAEPPDGSPQIRYAVSLERPEQIAGTANGTPITWSRTDSNIPSSH